MRLIISHQTAYTFETPATGVIQTLRLSPRSHEGQHIVRWRLDIDRDCRLRSAEDAFGNQTHVFAVDGPIDSLTVLVEGEVDTQDTNGIVRGAPERFPPALYLRETPLTAPDAEIAAFAAEASEAAKGDILGSLHNLLDRLHERMEFEVGPTDAHTTAAEAFRIRKGVCQDLTHVFLVAARSLGIPARYVGGYFRRDDCADQEAGHAWAEAYVPGLGWIGFDAANGACPTEGHVRVSLGLDYLGAAPVRGSRYGGSGETLAVAVSVTDALAHRAHRRS
ncbi:transglutaminase domain-containing protein [Hansschlegelia quercus]|uniref:Transglutaminase family protein n=1 Tax=Hansschlegelia quercus TaxID=2528245 RepID=A0A4Q9GLX4_9HYPH|nr:transglutaminase family protein [Hansschlegelia quercus]TBN54421.1 transglutaminase family protein [Hansschlegelia quercus]